MPQYGKVRLVGAVEEFVEEVTHDPLTPDMIKKLANGRPALRPIVVVPDPPFDPDTEKLGAFAYKVRATTVEKSHAPVPLTSAELKALARQKLAVTDDAWLEALEVLVDTLIAKGVIALADLPPAARDVLSERKALRVQL